MNKRITIIIILLIILFLLYKHQREKYGSGALLQLYAKGPQDRYLTDNKYSYPYFPYNPVYPYYGYYGYGPLRSPFLWNEPTRFRNNHAPYLLLTPDYMYYDIY